MRSLDVVDHSAEANSTTEQRDPALRQHYLHSALAVVPRLLASVDRNSFGPSYGCCDRQFWHYRTAAFPSEMYQEAALPLALAYARRLPGNAWYGEPRLYEAAAAAMRYSARVAHADGSCDDYYPFERALGAAVFSLHAQATAYRLLGLDDAELLAFFRRRAKWIADHGETGRLANHHALAALALWRTAELTDDAALRTAARRRIDTVLAWQHAEGWFDEYGGADLGYQTVTIDCLAKLRREMGLVELDEPLRRAVGFARCFLGCNGDYGGEYGSRGTRHAYPHGFELLAATNREAADVADAFACNLGRGRAAQFVDDRMVAHPVASLLEAYDDWSPTTVRAFGASRSDVRHFPAAGLIACGTDAANVVASTARGGCFHRYRDGDSGSARYVDAGLVAEFADGRVAVSQSHDADQPTEVTATATDGEINDCEITVMRPLAWVRFERATPLKQAALHLGMQAVGRFARNVVRRLLQRKVIASRGMSPLRITRRIQWQADVAGSTDGRLRVIDEIELTSAGAVVRRLAYASDLQAAYTAASNVYSPAMLQPWTDLAEHVATLNASRRVVIVREL